jgi:hypothetical protein
MAEGFLITVAQEYSRPAIGYGALVPLATVAGREPRQAEASNIFYALFFNHFSCTYNNNRGIL